jgi:hypothetical protein
VWGYPAEVKIFNTNIGKLDSKTMSCYFIGYPDKSKGFRFYCPDRYTKQGWAPEILENSPLIL